MRRHGTGVPETGAAGALALAGAVDAAGVPARPEGRP